MPSRTTCPMLAFRKMVVYGRVMYPASTDPSRNCGTKSAGVNSTNAVVQSLTAQRESLSGVSLDEEAISLMSYQKAFEASSRFIALVNTLMDDVLRILGG